MPAIADIINDLKESHYFQAFSVLWLILVVVFFVGFGNLVAPENNSPGKFKNYGLDTENLSGPGIPFPSMLVRPLNPQRSLVTLACSGESGVPITVEDDVPCTVPLQGNNCKRILSNKLVADPVDNSFVCLALFSGNYSKFSDGELVFMFDSDFQETSTLESGRNTDILLKKTTYKSSQNGYQVRWNPAVISFDFVPYNGSVGDNGNFIELNVRMTDFLVQNYLELHTASYVGWKVFGDIGGLMFSLYAIHSLVMFVLGMFLTNDSRVLGGAKSSYDRVEDN